MKILALNFDVREIRIIPNDGQPLFCLADIGEVLGIKRPSPKRFNLKENGIFKITIGTNGGNQILNFINEENLYHVLIRSRKPKAREFQDWVAKDALPLLRKSEGAA
ncbi:Bro-N domain-containing protein [Acinetobacter radioresistens]|uniref:BRO-N domain-containing protein n=1 Tax=Acinetobacter radioresistens TaxID=40216 RepID=UPI003B28CA7F